MEDFFNQFRDNLENRPEPPFREGDWQDLENRLDRQGGKRSGFAWWWAVLPFMALLLVSNLYFFLEWKKSSRPYTRVEILTDTVYQTKVIHTTDTIYKTRMVRETKVEYLNSPSFAIDSRYLVPDHKHLSLAGSGSVLFDDHFKTVPEQNTIASLNDFVEWKKRTLANEREEALKAIFNTEVTFLKTKTTDLLKSPEYPLLDLMEIKARKKKKTLSQQLYTMRPKRFGIGGQTGWTRAVADRISPLNGYSGGLELEVWFSDDLKLWLETSYVRTKYEITDIDPAYGVPEPSNGPQGDDFVFEKAEVPQPTMQYSAGLQYLFNAQNRWKPTIGMGYGAVSLLSYELLYEFENTMDDFEFKTDERIKRNESIADFLFLRAGFEYEMNRHWNWHLLSTYRTHWSDLQYKTLKTFGIQTGLSYRF